jgi:NADH:ubiquinone oxidoreductase subunit 6 (subunit J)
MVIRGMNLPLIISCIVIILALIILPLIVSYKAEKKDKNNKNEWDKIKEYGNNINKKTRGKY